MAQNPGNRIRVFTDLHPCTFVPLCFCGFAGSRICCFVRKRGCCSAASFLGRERPAVSVLITDEERRRLLANDQTRAVSQGIDPLPVVRLFTPDAHAT